jgi:hypothetical protein
LNAWGVVIIALGGGLIYWAAKHAGSLSELLSGATETTTGTGANKVTTPTAIGAATGGGHVTYVWKGKTYTEPVGY